MEIYMNGFISIFEKELWIPIRIFLYCFKFYAGYGRFTEKHVLGFILSKKITKIVFNPYG